MHTGGIQGKKRVFEATLHNVRPNRTAAAGDGPFPAPIGTRGGVVHGGRVKNGPPETRGWGRWFLEKKPGSDGGLVFRKEQ